ncbi:hypothetical protein CC85DRAFT_283454 [Cutaneotrichosporon oleaginosum]|uniref:Uncharacterized protein n=1 Tax=Cutaneotrichosporon oleaginosum TaxID=879819 RepID=A0A0J0XTW6_9TREE|nr:uncharacterized protein CC85DRAFT_283454 [Cutaneotrichosporon oleaginosum]KLT44515.1 hypothetical protein CC85DRAFT_283454 [Cutaneotrichosporon oleaginosum]TXT13968.1 hypothetical protein COLE_00161 [Cutaneotrichosporon oleaginosum]
MAFESLSRSDRPQLSLNLPRSCALVSSAKVVTRVQPSARLFDLPDEILRQIHLYSGSAAFGVVDKQMRISFDDINYKARWALYTRCTAKEQICSAKKGAAVLDQILSLRLCNQDVLERVLELWERRLRDYERAEREEQLRQWERSKEHQLWDGLEPGDTPPPPSPPRPTPRPNKIPRRLLRTPEGARPRLHPFVRYLVERFDIPPDADSSYPLMRGAADANYELVRFLLERGAKVTMSEHIAFRAAIHNKDLKMMKLLVEVDDQQPTEHGGSGARNIPLLKSDRLQCPREWVDLALKSEAYDIAHWLVDEKGLTPSLDRIMSLEVAGSDATPLGRLAAQTASRAGTKRKRKQERRGASSRS